MTEELFSEPLTRRDIKKILGLNEENFSFYVKWGHIKKATKGKFKYALKMHDMILERGTVFKYCFEDSYEDDLKEFGEVVKHTGKCKTWSRDEIPVLEKKIKSETDEEKIAEMQKRIAEIKSVLKIT